MMRISRGALLCLLLVGLASGYHNGAGLPACDSLFPGHGYDPQMSPSPYWIELDKEDSYDPSGEVAVSLHGKQPIKGFLLVATNDTDGDFSQHMGSFEAAESTDESLTKPLCDGNRAITHSKPLDKYTIPFIWKAPSDATGTIYFYVTVVQDFGTYWIRIPSDSVKDRSSTDETTSVSLPPTTTSMPTTTTQSVNSTQSLNQTEGTTSANETEKTNVIELLKGFGVDVNETGALNATKAPENEYVNKTGSRNETDSSKDAEFLDLVSFLNETDNVLNNTDSQNKTDSSKEAEEFLELISFLNETDNVLNNTGFQNVTESSKEAEFLDIARYLNEIDNELDSTQSQNGSEANSKEAEFLDLVSFLNETEGTLNNTDFENQTDSFYEDEFIDWDSLLNETESVLNITELMNGTEYLNEEEFQELLSFLNETEEVLNISEILNGTDTNTGFSFGDVNIVLWVKLRAQDMVDALQSLLSAEGDDDISDSSDYSTETDVNDTDSNSTSVSEELDYVFDVYVVSSVRNIWEGLKSSLGMSTPELVNLLNDTFV